MAHRTVYSTPAAQSCRWSPIQRLRGATGLCRRRFKHQGSLAWQTPIRAAGDIPIRMARSSRWTCGTPAANARPTLPPQRSEDIARDAVARFGKICPSGSLREAKALTIALSIQTRVYSIGLRIPSRRGVGYNVGDCRGELDSGSSHTRCLPSSFVFDKRQVMFSGA
jgi:hypothetical protein